MIDVFEHTPVMLDEVVEHLNPQEGEVFVDCTLGGAGHSVEIAKHLGASGLLIGIDQDPVARQFARKRLESLIGNRDQGLGISEDDASGNSAKADSGQTDTNKSEEVDKGDNSTNPYSLVPNPSSDSSSTNPYSLVPNPSQKIGISAQVLIPHAAGAEIADHKTVWGWGHGFAGTVEFSEVGAYIYISEGASLNKTSQAHIIFPASCLVNYNKSSQTNVGGARKNFAISEEESWTDEWAVEQGNSALVSACTCAAAFMVTLMATIAYAGLFRKYKRILSDNVSLTEQLAFDERALKFQKRMLVLSFTLLLICLFCVIFVGSIAGAGAFFLSFITCLLQCNWTPSVHRSFRDRING